MARLALAEQAKRDVHVSREKLLATLKSNREKHIKDYEEAMAGYKEQAMASLEKAVEAARSGIEKNYLEAKRKIEAFDPNDAGTNIDYMVLVKEACLRLPLPVCYSKAYDSAIATTEWDEREVLELTHAQFECFVRDIWDWSEEFVGVTSIYKKSL